MAELLRLNDIVGRLSPAVPPAMAQDAARLLAEIDRHDLKLATAESCTGGLLASLLTDMEGLSHVFERGFVTYSEAAKCDLLGVAKGEIARCGAVSREVAIAMARGAIANSEADIACAITGFAGEAAPGDETGLVHVAAASRKGRLVHREAHFGDLDRSAIRIAAVEIAIEQLRMLLP